MADLKTLLAKIEAATGPDRRIDASIMCALRGYTMHEESDPANGIFAFWDGVPWKSTCHNCTSWPEITASLDAAIALVCEELPGWWWKVGTCHVSDDACLCPDFNDPVHGARLRARYFPIEHNGPYDGGFDIDRRPPGNLPLALLEALLQALIAEETIQTQRSNAYGN